jgi:class 3 adenylate cyclase
MADLPTGTVTFLSTDIEGSTALWGRDPAAMRAAVARHEALLNAAIAAHGGHVFRRMGDGLCAAFATATAAVAAALGAQRALGAESWGETGPLRARMALHTGAVELRDGAYLGPCLNRLGRLLAIGHGGQVLLSQATAELVRGPCRPARACVIRGRTGYGIQSEPSRSINSCIPRCRPPSRRCSRWRRPSIICRSS